MNRRGFLQAILAAAVAPAVVKAESLMKLRPISDSGIVGFGYARDWLMLDDGAGVLGGGDFTIEFWGKLPGGQLHSLAQVRKGRETVEYIDGERVGNGTIELLTGGPLFVASPSQSGIAKFYGSRGNLRAIDEFRVTAGVARDIKPIDEQRGAK